MYAILQRIERYGGIVEIKRLEFKPPASLYTYTVVHAHVLYVDIILTSRESACTRTISSANNSHCQWYSLIMQIVNFKRSKKGGLFPHVPRTQPFPSNHQNTFQLTKI